MKTDLLSGQRDSDFAVPLEDFTTEVVDILDAEPDVREIQIENVKLLRYPKARGDYAEAVALINEADLHGK